MKRIATQLADALRTARGATGMCAIHKVLVCKTCDRNYSLALGMAQAADLVSRQEAHATWLKSRTDADRQLEHQHHIVRRRRAKAA